ncbi:MAG: hypothetical protein FK731_14200, partial [Asgard group archaeon]|nr:hypothetical protein [Asgard group archaeon]
NPYRILFVMDDDYGGNCQYIIQIFKGFGWEITTTATKKIITGCSYVSFAEFEVNKTLSELESFYLFDCISILPGDSHENLLDNTEFHSLIQQTISRGTIVTAWCRAVRILARADVIDGKNTTGHADYEDEYIAAGATFNLLSPPIADGNLITSVRSQFYRQQTCDLIKATVEDNKPAFIDFSTFLGGTGDEQGLVANLHYLGDTAVDSKGNIIVIGRTTSIDFPVFNAFQDSHNGNLDVTVSKFYPNGSLIFSTYLGGSAHEWATSVEIDSEDNIVLAGITGSEDFPLENPYQSEHMGGAESNADIFVAKLAEDGQSLIFSTFLGGTNSDWCYTLKLDANDRIAISGTTSSTNFPLLNPHQNSFRGILDSYLTVFEADGQSLLFSTYLGTTGQDNGRGIGFNSYGVFLTGQMGVGDLGTEGAFQGTHAGGTLDAYLARFNINGTLEYFSFLGGTAVDRGNDIAIDGNENIILTGYTMSSNYPVLNAYQEENKGSCELFITKLNPTGENIIFSTYLGGGGIETGEALTVDQENNILITGKTKSNDYPITHNPNRTYELTEYDAFVSKIKDDGSRLLFSTTFGGEEEDVGIGICWYLNQSYVISGFTKSEEWPIYHAYQGEYAGNCDLFLMKISTEDVVEIPTSEIGIVVGVVGGCIIILIPTYLIQKRHKKTNR